MYRLLLATLVCALFVQVSLSSSVEVKSEDPSISDRVKRYTPCLSSFLGRKSKGLAIYKEVPSVSVPGYTPLGTQYAVSQAPGQCVTLSAYPAATSATSMPVSTGSAPYVSIPSLYLSAPAVAPSTSVAIPSSASPFILSSLRYSSAPSMSAGVISDSALPYNVQPITSYSLPQSSLYASNQVTMGVTQTPVQLAPVSPTSLFSTQMISMGPRTSEITIEELLRHRHDDCETVRLPRMRRRKHHKHCRH